MLMTDTEVVALCAALQLSDTAVDYVSRVRSSAPSRSVSSSGVRNTTWRYPSFKMGHTVSTESTLERSFATLCESDPEVLEYWDQPEPVQLLITAANGKPRRVGYTPDFLVIRKDRVELVQVKPKEACEDLLARQPNRWQRQGATLCDVAADERFARMGLRHHVVTDSDINAIKVENLELLMRAKRAERPKAYQRLIGRALGVLAASGPQPVSVLLQELGIQDATPLMQMIGDGAIVADLERSRLSRLHDAWVAIDESALRAHVAATVFLPAAFAGDSVPAASSSEVQAACSRSQQISGEVPTTRSERTLRRWRTALKKIGKAGLIPRSRFQGNRSARVPAVEMELLRQSIERHYLTPVAPTPKAAFHQYLLDHAGARAEGKIDTASTPISLPTFYQECKRVDPEQAGRSRGGRRLANAMAAPVDPMQRSLGPLRPFERAQVDHYTCDLHVLVGGRDEGFTLRPYLTALRDQYSGVILAMSLGFRHPSRWACSGVLRDCVRRHGRLPETIAVDGGPDFISTYFDLLVAHYGLAKQTRSAGNGRGGGEIESSFKSVCNFLQSLPGGTANDAKKRAVSSSHKGQKLARLDFPSAHKVVEDFLFGYFNIHPIGSALRSPQELFSEGMANFGLSGAKIDFDSEFLARSALPLARTHGIDPQRGIKHLERWHFAKELLGRGTRARVQVFQEPWDCNRLYALVDGALVTCTHGASRRELTGSGMEHVLESIMFAECSHARARLQRKRQEALGMQVRIAYEKGQASSYQPHTAVPKSQNVLPAPRSQPIPFKTKRRDDGRQ